MKVKRKARAYKISDKAYLSAMKRCGEEKNKLAGLIEYFVTSYGEGYNFLRGREDFEKGNISYDVKFDFKKLLPVEITESKTDKHLPGLTAGMKQVKKEVVKPKSNYDRFAIMNKIK